MHVWSRVPEEAATDPRAILAGLLSDPADIPSLTTVDVAQATGRTVSQIAHATWNGALLCAYVTPVGRRNRERRYAPAEIARWIKNQPRD